MILLACSNCWFDPLQYGPLGLPVAGYCVEHRVVLRHPDHTTCGRLLRKDLDLDAAVNLRERHRRLFGWDAPESLLNGSGEAGQDGLVEQDARMLAQDPVGEAVTDYGRLDAKIESLSRLRATPGARAELAMLSLARGYVHRCSARGGSWTSGLHLLRWTRQRLDEVPNVGLLDLRSTNHLPLRRLQELASWSLVMLRLALLSDIGRHATRPDGHAVRGLAGILEEASVATGVVSLGKLIRWVRREGIRRVDAVLPPAEVERLANELHRDEDRTCRPRRRPRSSRSIP